MKIISLKIDVTKIDKARLFKGEKGTYLDATFLYNDEPDQYENNGMIVQAVSEEERKQKVRGTILGNGKVVFDDSKQAPERKEAVVIDDDDSILPF